MNRPGAYVERIRAHPYGPREIQAGGVTAWFHGPFAVLTLTGETALTLRADIEDASIGTDLAELFSAAEAEQSACLPHPGLLACEQPLTDDSPNVVHGFAVQPRTEGLTITVQANGRAINALCTARDAARLTEEIRRWAAPR